MLIIFLLFEIYLRRTNGSLVCLWRTIYASVLEAAHSVRYQVDKGENISVYLQQQPIESVVNYHFPNRVFSLASGMRLPRPKETPTRFAAHRFRSEIFYKFVSVVSILDIN